MATLEQLKPKPTKPDKIKQNQFYQDGRFLREPDEPQRRSRIRGHQILPGVQQHALPQGGQGEQSVDVRLQKLRLQTVGRQQLHLRQQDHARGGRDHQHRDGRDRRSDVAAIGGSSVSQVQTPRGRFLPGNKQH